MDDGEEINASNDNSEAKQNQQEQQNLISRE